MKASIKFRDDDRPLMRAKVPIGVLGLPFQTGLSAGGDPRELRFDLSTAFSSGPALRLSYRPNDPGVPFALSVRAGVGALGSPARAGVGALGSPARAPFSLAAEFNLLSASSSGSPAFFLLLKPRLGDFSLSHTLRSSSTPPPRTVLGEASENSDGLAAAGLDYKAAFSSSGNGLVAAAGRSGAGGLLSGMRLATSSVLPLWGRAAMRFSWDIHAPPGLLAVDGRSTKDARAPVSKMPLLVINKICIEQSPRTDADTGEDKKKKSGRAEASPPADADVTDDGEGFSLMRRQLEAMSAESGMLRRAVEDLRAEIGRGRAGGEARRAPPPQPHHALSVKSDRQGNGKELTAAEKAAMPASDEVGEELKRALEARLR